LTHRENRSTLFVELSEDAWIAAKDHPLLSTDYRRY